MRAVKEQADRLDLRTRRRTAPDGTISGGGLMGVGHIHSLLTNPIYAGRIRHRGKVFDGRHPAIIDPARWGRIQQHLQEGAAKVRARRTAQQRSRLCGKLFDETGDRLTPSHTKTRKDTRLRYYVSRRMIAAPGFAARILPEASADQIGRAAGACSDVASGPGSHDIPDLVARIDIAPGRLNLCLDAEAVARSIGVERNDLVEDGLAASFPFQLRKRGVETKIILADAPADIDETLLCNRARAHVWFDRIKAGETVGEIASKEATSRHRIQQMIGLAFLAPDILRDVMAGHQPVGFTSDWCKNHDLPANWTEQRRILATL